MGRHQHDDEGRGEREIARRPGRSHPPSLLRLAERLIREERLIERGDVVLCACSGGPDSTALLSVMARLRERFGFTLVADGVDQGLRGGAREELGCAERAAGALRVPFATTSVHVATGGNLQARAREARRGALRAAARLAGARLLATGHTADDRAETFLLRLLRGAGPRGLAVLPPSAPLPDDDGGSERLDLQLRGDRARGEGAEEEWEGARRYPRGGGGAKGLGAEEGGRGPTRGKTPRSGGKSDGGITLIRPLLLARRVDVEAHLVRHGLVVGRDPSNDEARFLRVRVRKELLPLMEEMGPGVAEHLCALADMLAELVGGEAQGDEVVGLGRAQRLAVARAKKCERAVNLLVSGGREVKVGFADGKAVLMREGSNHGPRRASASGRVVPGDRSRATSGDPVSVRSDDRSTTTSGDRSRESD